MNALKNIELQLNIKWAFLEFEMTLFSKIILPDFI